MTRTVSVVEEELALYRSKLNEISSLLGNATESESSDLLQVQQDLKELVTVTEEELISLKKSELLSCLDQVTPEVIDVSSDEYSDSSSTSGDGVGEADSLLSCINEMVGMKCCAPFTIQNQCEFYPAIVFEIFKDPSNSISEDDVIDADTIEAIKVKVLFTNPLLNSMQPCPYFLDDRCNYGTEKCKYSHGYTVSLSELRPYCEPDFANVSEGTVCLALTGTDKLWQRCCVVSVSRAESQVCVKLDTTGREIAVHFEHLFPLRGANNRLHLNSESDHGSDTEFNQCSSQFALEDSTFSSCIHPTSSSKGPVGCWEKHTKGFGSRIMAKMGYVVGEGLGKQGQGRAHPIEVRVLPSRFSLDTLMQAKAGEAKTDPSKAKRKQKRKLRRERIKAKRSAENRSLKQVELGALPEGICEFLNRKLAQNSMPSSSSLSYTTPSGTISSSCVGGGSLLNSSIPPGSVATNRKAETFLSAEEALDQKKSVNIKLLKLEEDIKSTEKDIQRYKHSIERNKADPRTVQSLQNRQQEATARLQHLKRTEREMRNEQNRFQERRKMTVF